MSRHVGACLCAAALGALLPATISRAQLPFPVGSQFQVNSYTTQDQRFPSIAVDPAGNFVVVWESVGSSGGDTSLLSVQGQRFDVNASPIGVQFQVNTYTTNAQYRPAVTVDSAGDFVVVWQSYGSSGGDTAYRSIQGQRFDSGGTPAGSQFQVNTYTTDVQASPAVAADALGNFVVVWNSFGSSGGDTSSWSIQGQRFDSSGSPLGSQFQVNTYTTNVQYRPAVAVASTGAFVVVWQSQGSSLGDNDSYSIQGQRFDSAGSATGSQFQVNTYTTGGQYQASVGIDTAGDFVVVWRSGGSSYGDLDGDSVQGQRFAANGSLRGGQFQVNTYTTGNQRFPRVVVGAALGNFVVAWQSLGSSGVDAADYSIQGQRFADDGSSLGGQFQVNTYTTGDQLVPAVGVRSNGAFVVAWRSNGSSGSDSSYASVQGQRFGATGIFLDDFESSDLSHWSLHSP
jgi:hypothetical protein